MEHIMAFDLGGTEVKYGVVTSDYEILSKGKIPTPYDGVERLLEMIKEITDMNQKIYKITGIALSLPGSIEKGVDGVVERGGKLRYLHRMPLGKLISEATGLPVTLENDGRCGALGEYCCGELKGCQSGVVIILGTGVGGGILLNGTLLEGFQDFAGRFAHIISGYDKEKKEYRYWGGDNGKMSLQKLVLEAMGKKQEEEIDGRKIFEWIQAGNKEAERGFSEFCRMLAVQITNLQVILDPEIVVIGGGISAQPVLLHYINQELDKIYESHPVQPRAHVVLAKNGNASNLIGAVEIWKRQNGL